MSLNRLVFAGVAVLTLLFLVPFWPGIPAAGLDPSWSSALNEGLTRHWIFGRDLIFTLGPLASVHTGTYHPGTDSIMLIGAGLIAAAMLAGFWLISRPRLWMSLGLLLALSTVWLRDPAMLILPVLLLLAAARIGDERGPMVYAAFAALAISMGLLPLMKSSYGPVVAVELLLACGLLLHAGRRDLVALLVAVTSIALVCAWIGTGQPLSALPQYFLAQVPIISGYGGAMSVKGKPWLAAGFALVCLLIVSVSARGLRSASSWPRAAVLLGLGFYLFVSFKAGFVRHDQGHVLLAGGTFPFVAAALACVLPPRSVAVMVALCVAGWITMERAAGDLPMPSIAERLSTPIPHNLAGIQQRIQAPGALQDRFQAANAAILATSPFKPGQGTVDVYPYELSTIFAAGANWAGRPVFQSYSAYSRSLLEANAHHLQSDKAAQTIYFTLEPIDNRLPALDDSLSWPILFSKYDITGQEGPYLRLERRADRKVSFSPGQHREPASGEAIEVAADGMQWATVDLAPSWLGRLVDLLYVLPRVDIELTLADSRVVTRRLIPAITRAGFLLSPYVETTRDYALAPVDPSINRVTSIRVIAPRPWLWKNTVRVSLQGVNVDPKPTSLADRKWQVKGFRNDSFAQHIESIESVTLEHLFKTRPYRAPKVSFRP